MSVQSYVVVVGCGSGGRAARHWLVVRSPLVCECVREWVNERQDVWMKGQHKCSLIAFCRDLVLNQSGGLTDRHGHLLSRGADIAKKTI